MKTLFFLLLAAGNALADDAAILRCREIPAAAARLACYDAVPVLPRGAGPAALAPSSARAPDPAAEQAIARNALEQSFGMEYNKKTTLDAIESHIPGKFDGWGPRQKITLANGQVWMIVDDSDGVMYGTNPKVKIARGALGAIYMEIDGINKAPKVRRLQ